MAQDWALRRTLVSLYEFCKRQCISWQTQQPSACREGFYSTELITDWSLSDRSFDHHYYFFIIILRGVRLSPLGIAATTGLLYQPQMTNDGDCGAIGGMKIGRGNRSTRRKPAPAPLCPPQIPHDQTRTRTPAAAVGRQRLTAWVTVWPSLDQSSRGYV
jgi:hypothetical protein